MSKTIKRPISFVLAVLMVLASLTVLMPLTIAAAVTNVGENIVGNGSFENYLEPSDSITGWSYDDGFTVAAEGSKEGANSLVYKNTSTGMAYPAQIELEANSEYIFSAWVKKTEGSNASISLSYGSEHKTFTCTDNDVWVTFDQTILAEKATTLSISVTAKGEAWFDDISIRKVSREVANTVKNGDFENSMANWSLVAGQAFTSASEVFAGDNSLAVPATGSITRIDQRVNIKTNTWYLLSAEVYRETNASWTYLDLNDIDGELQLRGTKTGEWESISGLWYSGSTSSVNLRIIAELNWDNPSQSSTGTGNTYFDNVSFVEANVGDELIADPGFEGNSWLLNDGSIIAKSTNTHYFYGKNSIGSTTDLSEDKDAIATANEGKTIQVKPFTDYFISGYIYRTGGSKTAAGSLEIADPESGNQLFTISGTRYNCTTWNISTISAWHQQHWEYVSGTWNSGANTEVKVNARVTAESGNVTDTVYFDEVSFREASTTLVGANQIENGGLEAYRLGYEAEGWNLNADSKIVNDAKYGTAALLVKGKAESDAITVKPNSRYKLSAYVKAEDAAQIKINKDHIFSAQATGEWELVTGNFSTDVDDSEVVIGLTSEGGAVFDYISIEEVATPQETVYISDLEYVDYANEGSYLPWIDNDSSSGNTGKISIGSEEFDKGIRLHPDASHPAYVIYNLEGEGYTRFTSFVGKDRASQGGNVQFKVYGDGRLLAESPIMTVGQKHTFDVDITGVNMLKLELTDGGDNHAWDGGCWADAKLYRTILPGRILITAPTKADEIVLGNAVEVKGVANADQVKIYVDGTVKGIVNVDENLGWQYDLALNGNKSVLVEAEAIIGSSAENRASVTVKRAEDTIYLTDLPANANGNGYEKNISISVGGGAVSAVKGFTITPFDDLGESSAATVNYDIAGLGYTYFEGIVGLADGRDDSLELGRAQFAVLADGVEIAKTAMLAADEVELIACDIPAGTQKLTLKTLNGGNAKYAKANWVAPKVARGVDALYGNWVKAYDDKQSSKTTQNDMLGMQVNTKVAFTGVKLPASVEGDVTLAIYKWAGNYSASLSAVALYALTVEADGETVIPIIADITAGEYIITLEGEGTINKYASTVIGTYDKGSSSMEALELELNFAEETGSYFSAISALDDLTPLITEATSSEINRAKAIYEGYLDNLETFPVTFKVGDTRYNGFNGDFTIDSQKTTIEGNKESTVTVMTHTSGLTFELQSVYYPEYAAYDFTLYFSNNTAKDSPIVSDVRAYVEFEGADPYVITSKGDSGKFEPVEFAVTGKRTFAPTDGRSTEGAFPYYNVMYGDGGALLAIGWTQQWSATFNKTTAGMSFTAGQEVFASYLMPGETARTPLFAFVLYDGRDADRASNLWRNWYIDCNMERIGDNEEDLFPGQLCSSSSGMFAEMTQATDENQINVIKNYVENDIDITYHWMDAGWYYMPNGQSIPNHASWLYSGGWNVDAGRFASAFKDISYYGQQHGVKTLLWFEPEIVRDVSMLQSDGSTIRREWMLNTSGWCLVDMGNQEAVTWIRDKIFSVMDNGGISLYREDYGITGVQNILRSRDGANRAGMTENKYVQGHLWLWDEINDKYTGAVIDSCASGGKRNDLETLRRAVPLHKTDYNYHDADGQQAYHWGMGDWMPYFGTKGVADPVDYTYADRYLLRTALSAFMLVSYHYDYPVDYNITRDITEEHKLTREYIYEDFYKLTPYDAGTTNWTAWEYINTDEGHGYAQFFRPQNGVSTQVIKLKGLNAGKKYHVWFEDMNKATVMSGAELMYKGVEVVLPASRTSDLLWFTEVGNNYKARNLEVFVAGHGKDGQIKEPISTSGNYYVFSLRPNMQLRDTVFAANNGHIETVNANEYAKYITINGTNLATLLASDSSAVKMEYNVHDLIFSVYVKKSADVINLQKDTTVVIDEDFATYEGVKLYGETTAVYEANAKDWSEAVVDGTSKVSSITVNGNAEMEVGETQQLTAVVLPDTASDKTVTWSSSNKAVAKVDEFSGVVTAVSVGEATIYASSNDGSDVAGTITIKVVEAFDPPAAPASVKAVSQSASSLKVSWSAVEGAEGYRVYRADSANGEYTLIYTAAASKLSVNNLNRVTGKTYYYKVCALVDFNGELREGELSAAKAGKAVPSKPKNVKAASVSATTIKVSWDAVAGAKGYKLYASATGKDGSFYLSYTTNDPAKTSVNVLNRKTGSTYYFKVRAISSYNGATVSGTLSAAVTGKAIPATPVVTISKASATSIRNKWKAVYGADGYEVYRSLTGKTGTFYLQKRTEYLSYANTKLKTGQPYYYKVRAYKLVDGKRVYGNFSTVKSYTL